MAIFVLHSTDGVQVASCERQMQYRITTHEMKRVISSIVNLCCDCYLAKFFPENLLIRQH